MELSEAIYSRKSIRKFMDTEIKEEHLKKIIDSAIHAPSACDLQGWKFIVIKDKKIKKIIIDAGAASFIIEAPVGTLVLYDNRTDNLEFRDDIKSAAAAIQNMTLTAWSIGIGSCWVCHLPLKKQLRKILDIPPYYNPIAYVAMGYYKDLPKKRARKLPLEKVICYDRFNFNEKAPSIINFITLKRILRKVYYHIPFRKYIKKGVDKLFEKKFE